jgi:nucleoid-associated protein YgaU
MQYKQFTRTAIGCVAITSLMLAVGCSTGTKSGRAATGDDVLDVGSTSFDNSSFGTGATSGGMVDMNGGAASSTVYTPSEPAPVVLAPVATASRQHTIVKGDTAWSLAVRYYGDGKQFPRIFQANPGLSERNFPAGKTIVIP